MNRVRLNVLLEREHAKRLSELACMKRVPKSGIVAAALASYLSPDGGDRRDAMIAKRLEKLTNTFERMDRDQMILIETLALFIRHHFAIAPTIPEAQQGAARAQGRARFEQFIEQLARQLQRGQSLFRDTFKEIAPEGSDLTSEAQGS